MKTFTVKYDIVDSIVLHQKSNTGIFIIDGKKEDMQKVEDILENMDKDEFENYYPERGLVRLLDTENVNRIPYNHKFSCKVAELKKYCAKVEIKILVVSFNSHNYEEGLTLEQAIMGGHFECNKTSKWE